MTADSPASVPARSSPAGKLLALVGVVVSCAYLANIGAGIFGEIPDILPVIGNLDEVFFSGLLIACLQKLGLPILPGLSNRKSHLALPPKSE
ncbi:MAG: hypothetical protein WD872_13230 [Pirellulaceae bacterium]